MTFAELHPRDVLKLRRAFGRDERIAILERDGYEVLNASVPPKERRGLVLIDPPFEAADEYQRLAAVFDGPFLKWPTGTYALWYPVKSDGLSVRFLKEMARRAIPKTIAIEMTVLPKDAEGIMRGCGMLVVNPPYTLAEEAMAILPELTAALSNGAGQHRIVALSRE